MGWLASLAHFRLPRLTSILVGGGLMAGMLSSCAPDLGPAPTTRPITGYASAQSLAAPSVDWPSDAWWTAYGDPQAVSRVARLVVTHAGQVDSD